MIFVFLVSCVLLIYSGLIKLGHHMVSFNRYLALFGFGLAFLSLGHLTKIYTCPWFLEWALILFLLHGLVCIIYLYVFSKRRQHIDFVPEVIFVFGAGLIQNRISRSLRKRLDKAVEMAVRFPYSVVVVSGGQGKNEWISEGKAMADYLKSRGIKQMRILVEEKSTTTQENLVFSMRQFNIHTKKILLVSNSFHVYRTEKMARKLGLDAIAISAPMISFGTPAFYIREYFALIKAFLKNEL